MLNETFSVIFKHRADTLALVERKSLATTTPAKRFPQSMTHFAHAGGSTTN